VPVRSDYSGHSSPVPALIYCTIPSQAVHGGNALSHVSAEIRVFGIDSCINDTNNNIPTNAILMSIHYLKKP
jgi:hypothetical protein